MLHPKQLITLFKSTSQILFGQRYLSSESALPVTMAQETTLTSHDDYKKTISPANKEAEQNQQLQNGTSGNDNEYNDNESATITEQAEPDTKDSNSVTDNSKRIVTGSFVCKRLEDLSSMLKDLSEESDPQFVKIGRDLTTVTKDVKNLTETIHKAVSLIQNDDSKEESSLKKTEKLIQEVFSTLSEDRRIIDVDANEVHNLVSSIFKCDQIREQIGRINSLFRIVRINIRIQCTARGLSEELFEGVSEDLEHLSETLHFVTKQILIYIAKGAKSLANLKQSIMKHLDNIDTVFQQTNEVVSKAFSDIKKLMQGTEVMIQEADSRSAKISDWVSDIVVRIQFHDSLNQRIEHIIHAFDDICNLCRHESHNITDNHLGTAFIILDLQLRQLLQISKEIKLVRNSIGDNFLSIESEVEGLKSILHDRQFKEVDTQQFLSSAFASLEETLVKLNSLHDEGEGMMNEIEKTSAETKTIAYNLEEMKDNVADIRDETRIQALNTIIMASALGRSGKTIEVLAKEIQNLSDLSSVLSDDVESMQLAVSQTVEDLIANTTRKDDQIAREDLEDEIASIKITFRKVIDKVSEISRQIEISGNHIRSTRSSLFFLESLQTSLDSIINDISQTRDTLAPWEGKGTSDSKEVEKLIERYSMEQERIIHMYDRVNEEQEETEEDEIFF